MKYRMPPLPRKQAVALDLLERTSVFVHLDPRRPGVVVPPGFLKQPQLVLQIGLNMAISIPDLDVADEGISCTLSFNKRPHFCRLPWSAIYALIGEQGGGMVWPEDVPPEVVSQQRAAAKKETKPRRAGLRAISGEAADRNGDDAEVASTRRSETPRPGGVAPGDVRPGEVRRDARGNTPPRLVQVVSNPASAESAPASQSGSSAESAADSSADSSAVAGLQQPNETAREQNERPPTTKRSRPPYLRLV
jgi:stringent starvation protein B